MEKDWKSERAEAAIKEGTDKIMKAAQALAKKKSDTLFPKKVEQANKILDEVGGLPELEEITETSFDFCVGIGTNQLFPEYIKIDLSDDLSE